ncbi:MAG: ankyrin repeat domain-containing protein, partial [Synergistaceae bacterium]|nr:ankyrin repeat domain-containing protein [Synergistaceae bacterium]
MLKYSEHFISPGEVTFMFMKLKSKLKLLMGKITKSERNDTIFTAVALVILVTLIAVTWRIFFYKAPFNPWEHEEPQLARLTGADTALFRAVRGGGMKDILRSLLEGGSPDAVNENGVTPFKAAIALSRLDAVREFIETGRGDIDSYKTAGKWDTLLVYAVVHNRPPIVKELAKLSPNVNALDRNGYTPLLYAVNYNNVNAAKELLNAGADVNAPGREGV